MYNKFRDSKYTGGVGIDSAMISKDCMNAIWDKSQNTWVCEDRSTCMPSRCPNPYI